MEKNSTKSQLPVIRALVNEKLGDLTVCYEHINAIQSRLQETSGDYDLLVAAASYLHNYYTAVENTFDVIAKKIDKTAPSGHQFHKDLLVQMSIQLSGRPAVIAKNTQKELEELMKFRHFFRHASSVRLSIGPVVEHLNRVANLHPTLVIEIQSFLAGPDRDLTHTSFPRQR